MKQTTLAYLAGTIDADGYITISRANKKIGKLRTPRVYYSARLGLSEIHPVVPDLLYATFGGSRYPHQPKTQHHQMWHCWVIQDRSAVTVLRALLPHLRLKHEQAAIVLDFLALTARQKIEIHRTQRPPYHVTHDMVQGRHALWVAITRLNKPRNRRVHFVDTPALEGPPVVPSDPSLA